MKRFCVYKGQGTELTHLKANDLGEKGTEFTKATIGVCELMNTQQVSGISRVWGRLNLGDHASLQRSMSVRVSHGFSQPNQEEEENQHSVCFPRKNCQN